MLIPKKILSLTKICATELTRYAINAVHFYRDKDGKCHAEATDGLMALRATWNVPDA